MKHTNLYPYQLAGVNRIQELGGRALLADSMGLGKSLQSLYWAWKYLPPDPPGPIVIVCPASIKFHWEREAMKHLGLRVEVLFGQTAPETTFDRSPNQIFVINYDILTQPRRDDKRQDKKRSWSHVLNAMKPRLVIGDEVHFCKNNGAARTRAFRRLCKGVPHLLLLSGTPLTNKPTDLWPALNILMPAEFPAFWPFAAEYTHPWKAHWGWVFRGAKNLDRLHNLLFEKLMIRRLKEDVLADLPPKTRTVVPIEIDRREYAKAENDFIGWLETTEPGKARRARKAEEISRMNELKRLAGRLKLPGVMAWVRDFFEATDEKLLLGAIHKKVTYPLTDEFEDSFGAIRVDGDCNDREKTDAFDRFNNHPDCRLMIGNIQAAGVGWSCRATSKVAIAELPWTPGECLQFEDRCHGVGRGVAGVPVNAYYLVAAETIESDLCEVLETKQGWLDQTLDGGEQEGGLDVHEQCKRLIKQRIQS